MTKPRNRVNGRGQSKAGRFVYVHCSVEPGMFKDELLVFADAVDPSSPDESIEVQLLVDAFLVKVSGTPERGRPVEGRLRVGLADVRGGYATVVLPQPGIPVGEFMVVRENALLAD